jgi:hypothetical protein
LRVLHIYASSSWKIVVASFEFAMLVASGKGNGMSGNNVARANIKFLFI